MMAAAQISAASSWSGFMASWGLALILAGQPIGWWVRGKVMPGNENPLFPIAIVFGGLAMIIMAGWGQRSRLHASPMAVALYPLLYILPMATLMLVDPVILLIDLAYLVFMVPLLLAVALRPLEDFRGLPIALALTAGLSSLLALSDYLANPASIGLQRLAVEGNKNPIVSGNTGGLAMVATMVVLLQARRMGTAVLGLFMLMFLAGLAAVILSNTRSALLGVVYTIPAIFLLNAFLGPEEKSASGYRRAANFGLVFLLLILAGLVMLVMLIGIPRLMAMSEFFLGRIAGAFSLLFDDSGGAMDESTSVRVNILRQTLEQVSLFGHGIQHHVREAAITGQPALHPHLSFLQILYDLGIAGLLLFLLTHLVLPAWLIVRTISAGALIGPHLLFLAMFLFRYIDLFTHGTPYGWLNLVAVALIYPVFGRFVPSGAATMLPGSAGR